MAVIIQIRISVEEMCIFDLRQYDSAFSEYTKGLERKGADIEDHVQADFNHRIGQLSCRKGDFHKAIGCYKRSLELFHSLNTDRLQVMYRRQELCGNITLSYWRLKALDISISWYDTALVYVNLLPQLTPRELQAHQVAMQVILGNQGFVFVEKGLTGTGFKANGAVHGIQ